MKVTCQTVSLLSVESSQVTSNVFANSFNLGEFAGRTGRGLGISEGSEFLSETIDAGPDGLAVTFTDLLIDFLFDHVKYVRILLLFLINYF